MKKRIKIDSAILSLLVVLTGFLFYFPNLYSENRLLDVLFNFFGFTAIYKGVMLRMAARAHKKHFSRKSEELVTSGLYSLVRNPMYLGTFTIGLGFSFLVWPWWMAPVFAVLFYWRFRREIMIEEDKLDKLFGHVYREYRSSVPRLFPQIKKMCAVRLRSVCNLDEAMSTKEKRGLFVWPLLAVIMESLQEIVVFGRIDFQIIFITLFVSAAIYAGVFIIRYE